MHWLLAPVSDSYFYFKARIKLPTTWSFIFRKSNTCATVVAFEALTSLRLDSCQKIYDICNKINQIRKRLHDLHKVLLFSEELHRYYKNCIKYYKCLKIRLSGTNFCDHWSRQISTLTSNVHQWMLPVL